MSDRRRSSLHSVIRAAVLLGFNLYILSLVKNGDILYYIAPRMVNYLKWTALGLYGAAIYQIYAAYVSLRGAKSCDCEHLPSSCIKSILIYTLFVFPLALGFLLPDATMGSALAAKKGMNLSAANTVRSSTPAPNETLTVGGDAPQSGVSADDQLKQKFPAGKNTSAYAQFGIQLYKADTVAVKDELFLQTLKTLDMYLNNFIGRKMELSGFVYRESGMPERQFVLGRFVVSCCSADATPYGVLVESDKAQSLPNDSWFKIDGTIDQTKYGDKVVLLLKADKLEEIPAPKTKSYIYPNSSFAP